MFGTLAMIVAGQFAAFSNLCMKKSTEQKGNMETFFFFQLVFTAMIVTFLFPVRTGNYATHSWMLLLAALGGISLGFMKFFLGKALVKGPPALTFTIMNSSSFLPALVFFLFFQRWVLCHYTLWHFLGSFMIILGLFLATNLVKEGKKRKSWVFFLSLTFLLQAFFLFAFEWRSIIIQQRIREPFSETFNQIWLDSEWFTPVLFFTAAFIHFVVFFLKRQSFPPKREFLWGVLGGGFNGLSAFFFTLGTEVANLNETAFLFPTFTIALIIGCHGWSFVLYKEKIHWFGNALCVLGLVFGSFFSETETRISKEKISIPVENEEDIPLRV